MIDVHQSVSVKNVPVSERIGRWGENASAVHNDTR
jgi:hypothetical protein